jgi:hypothetical protein
MTEWRATRNALAISVKFLPSFKCAKATSRIRRCPFNSRRARRSKLCLFCPLPAECHDSGLAIFGHDAITRPKESQTLPPSNLCNKVHDGRQPPRQPCRITPSRSLRHA